LSTLRVTALLTCHNRVERTLACLRSLTHQTGTDGVQVDVFLVDAGSSDGTVRAVRDRFPTTNVVERGAELFWNGGMRVAMALAYERDPDLYLWLNDDVVLDPGSLGDLIETCMSLSRSRGTPCIVVGSTRDPLSGRITYGGVARSSRWRPLRYERVEPGPHPRMAETMNGNVVLIPREVVRRVGTLASVYTHGMGDFDFGNRARRAGCEVWVAPGSIGTCARNPARATEATFAGHLRQATDVRGGLPPREWFAFARRWGGPLWIAFVLSPYLRGSLRWFTARCGSFGRRRVSSPTSCQEIR
jgi:GT2 family glycosyltransferase